jgi:Na+-transporting NADH:ubiquinone oxidoreductase subunit C
MHVNDSTKTLVFAAVLGLICSILLALASSFTQPYREANEEAEEKKNILQALSIPIEADADAKELLEVFKANVKIETLGEKTLYQYIPEGSAEAVALAVPCAGPGLWAPIKGIMALEPDMMTIRGIRFYQQEETPGLGGEIGAEWFQEQFVEKKLVSASGEPGFRIVKPAAPLDDNSVHGITAATMTSDRVATMLDLLAKEIATARSN